MNDSTTDSMNDSRWTFLTNHSHVLILLHTDGNLVLREVARRVGITERAVQRIVHNLEEAGYLERYKVGRQNKYRVGTDVSLRHPIESHRTIGDLLALFQTPPQPTEPAAV
jgi:DNA-binding Lrp family transcriptional regulator